MSTGEEETPLPSVGSPADPSQLASYLLRVVPALLESDEDVPEVVTLQTVLKENSSKLKRFIEDSQEHTLSIICTLPSEVAEGESSSTSLATLASATFDVHLGVVYRPQRSVGVIFTKRSLVLESDKSMRSQLRFLTVSEDSPFETLHDYVQDAINPLFNSFVLHSKGEEGLVPLFFLLFFLTVFFWGVLKKLMTCKLMLFTKFCCQLLIFVKKKQSYSPSKI